MLAATLAATTGCRPPSPPNAAAEAAASPRFRLAEVAQARGLAFRHTVGSRAPLTIVETMGSGCAFLDYDRDGWLDIFMVNAGDDYRKERQVPGSRLYHNRGDGTFQDVTARSGLAIDGYCMGCCIGDFDNDGWDDLFVSGFGRNTLLRNRGNGTFADVTRSAGIRPRPGAWGTGCAFVDVNRDGKLDLYVANYVRFDPSVPLCRSGSVMSGCTPHQYATQRNELYINRGGGVFEEKAGALGADDPAGAGLGVVVSDFDGDGWPDLFVANDGTPNALLHNVHGRFENRGDASGVAFSEAGVMRAGMGTDAADCDGDGLPDLVITNFQHEPSSFYRNLGNLSFEDVTNASGVGPPSVNYLKFGVSFADLDGDGQLDLYVGNGHVYDNVALFDDTATFEQPDQIFLNIGKGRFAAVSPSAGAYPAAPSVARGVAVGDTNNDGAPDVLVNNLGRPARLLENRRVRPGHWLGLTLRGTRGNRSAIGARVELRGPGGLQVREVRSGGSYLSQPDLRVLFALADVSDLARLSLRIRWPDGSWQPYHPAALDRYLTVEEPER